ncbi:MAG: cellulase family glycosylhydrolase, partial [Oscillospiraceae bacterium]|nr:cellulase family glycosylhydrolase [Oscillospiraceae bacterium]
YEWNEYMKKIMLVTKFLLLIFLLMLSTGCSPETTADSSAIFNTEPVQSAESVKQESEENQRTESSDIVGSTSSTPQKPSGGLTVPSASGKLCVNGTKLTDSKGNAVQLRGISTHGIAWFPDYINESCFRQLREEWKVNVIRLAMYTEEYGGYCAGGNQEQLKQIIHKGVSYAAAQDMYVIIDWHILSDGNPNRHIAEATAFFKEMSKKYANCNHVIYEICNEPNGGTSWEEIKTYAEKIIDIIRSNDKDAVILVGTPNWSQYVDQAARNPITKYDNIMYTLHFYAATHTDSLRNTMITAIKNGLPIFVSEYGICDASGNGAINEAQANQWIDTMDRYGISYVAWNLSNKAETSAILRSECKKISGFNESDLSSSGKWLYHMLTGKKLSHSPSNSGVYSSVPEKESSSTPNTESSTINQASGGKLSYTINLQNSWETDGQTFFQYNVAIKNNAKNPCSQWSIKITFNEDIALTDSWNGNYSVSGNVLTISSKDYNGTIPANGTTGNIGFIVKGSAKLKPISRS